MDLLASIAVYSVGTLLTGFPLYHVASVFFRKPASYQSSSLWWRGNGILQSMATGLAFVLLYFALSDFSWARPVLTAIYGLCLAMSCFFVMKRRL